MKITTFQHKRERTTTHLSGCVVASLFVYAPVVGVKLGGDAAAHPVFRFLNLCLPCHVYVLLAHTPLAALEPSTTSRLQAGVHLHSRSGSAVNCVLGYCGRIRNVRLLTRIISRIVDGFSACVKKVCAYSVNWYWFCDLYLISYARNGRDVPDEHYKIRYVV